MGNGKLHNAAYDLFVREYGIKNSVEYGKFEEVVKCLDILGKDLLGIGVPFSNPESHAKVLKANIRLTIFALINLANQQKLNIEDTLVEALEEYKNVT